MKQKLTCIGVIVPLIFGDILIKSIKRKMYVQRIIKHERQSVGNNEITFADKIFVTD